MALHEQHRVMRVDGSYHQDFGLLSRLSPPLRHRIYDELNLISNLSLTGGENPIFVHLNSRGLVNPRRYRNYRMQVDRSRPIERLDTEQTGP